MTIQEKIHFEANSLVQDVPSFWSDIQKGTIKELETWADNYRRASKVYKDAGMEEFCEELDAEAYSLDDYLRERIESDERNERNEAKLRSLECAAEFDGN